MCIHVYTCVKACVCVCVCVFVCVRVHVHVCIRAVRIYGHEILRSDITPPKKKNLWAVRDHFERHHIRHEILRF